VIDMHVATFRVFLKTTGKVAAKMKQHCEAGPDKKEKNMEILKKETKHALAEVRGEWPEMRDVYELSRDLHEKLRDAKREHEFLHTLDVHTVVNTVLVGVHTLLNNAIYTVSVDDQLLEALVTSGSDVEQAVLKAAGRTTKKLLNDSKLDLTATFKRLLLAVILPNVQKEVLEAREVKKVVEPLEKLIPDMAADFISIEDTLNDIVTDVVTQSVSHGVDGGTRQSHERLHAGMELAVANAAK